MEKLMSKQPDVIGSIDDIIIEPDALQGWRPYLMGGDRYWECQQGRHFFHLFEPTLVAEQILDFWQSLRPSDSVCSYLKV
jgi:hypothetical protein